jgi:gliding motility-associated-like protein
MKKVILSLITILICNFAFSQVFSTKGTDFWFGFMKNYLSPTPTVYISSDVATSGTITIPGQGFSQNYTVAANSTTSIVLPVGSAQVTANQTIENKAVHVISNDPVTVYALNYEAYSSDASIILPVTTLGIEYYTVNINPDIISGSTPTQFMIVGIQNGSQIEITPSVVTDGGNAAGVPFTVTLNQGETYQVKANGGDLSGTYVRSLGGCEKFAIFTGAECTNVGGCPYCDHLYEQLYPVSTWGMNYATSPYQTRSADIYRIVASQNGTNVTVNGGAPFTLNAGAFNQQTLSPASFIQADKPIMVMQYSRGGDCDGANADPFIINLSPVEQTLDNMTFNAFNSSVISSYFVNIISKTSTKNLVTLDGTAIGGFFTTIPSNTAYSHARRPISTGNHTIVADSGVVAYVYGYGSYESYGYVAGASLNNLGVSYNMDAQGQNFTFNEIPNANICSNSSIDFNGELGPFTVNSWSWDFGDGTNGTGQNVSHSYIADGTYTVTLTADIVNLCGSETVVVTQTINILNTPPPTTVTPSPTYMCPGDAVNLSVSSSNGGATHLWSTGGTGTSIVASPLISETFDVTTSWFGCTQLDTVQVIVRDPGTVPSCNVIYVSTTGNGVGTQADPTDLLTALSMSSCNGAIIRMATGIYNFDNPISTISSFTTIEGGFDQGSGWQKTSLPGATTINRTTANVEGTGGQERLVAIYGNGVHDFRLQDLTITTDDAPVATSFGISTYGMHLTGAYNYDLVRTQVLPGNASAGNNGTPGTDGVNGANGTNGQNGNNDNQSGGGGGGNGGAGGGALNAGAGGNGGSTTANNGGVGGAPAGINGGGGGGGASGGGEDRDGATGGQGGSGNAGGSPGQESGCNGGLNCSSGESGGDASQLVVGNGSSGTSGPAGSAGLITAGFWQAGSQGGNGTSGTGGEGGGGGGGGAGEGGFFCIDGHGSGGGGGGGGGQAGTGGFGGYGGGSSYGLYLFNNGVNGNVINGNVNAGGQGAGGAGGIGGSGGTGGNGGNGSTYHGGEVGCGGDGANGGDGGNGGNGGAGIPGQTIDILLDGGTALATSDASFNLTAQPVINVDNVTCTNTSTDFTSGSSATWDAGNGSTPATGTGTTFTSSYTTTGFKDIDFGSDTYTGFVNILVSGAGLTPVIGTNATLYGSDYHVCVGQSADFYAVSSGINYTYYWDFDNAITPSAITTMNDTLLGSVFSTPGTYNITLQIETPCCGLSAITTNITLVVDDIPTPAIAANPGIDICFGESTVLTASGGTDYLWDDGTTTATNTVTPIDTTLYSVTVTNFECTNSTDITVNPVLIEVFVSGADQICSGDFADLTANGSTGSSYQWSGGSTATTDMISVNPLTDTWYFVEATLNGCTAEDSILVQVTGVSAQVAASTQTLCVGDSAMLTVQGGSYYTWSTGETNDTIWVQPTSTTTYDVTVVWDSIGTIACNTSDQAFITVNAYPVPSINNVSADTMTCTFDQVTLSASGGSSILWSTGETTSSITPTILGDTTFIVNSVSSDGCLSISDTIFITTLPGIDNLSLSTTDATCVGSSDGSITSTVVGGVAPLTYLWNTGDTTQDISGIGIGIYDLTVTSANGCESSISASVLQGDSVFAAFAATPDSGLYPLDVSFINNSEDAISYTWDFGNGITSTNETPTPVVYDSGGVYIVTLVAYNANGCTDTATYEINVIGESVVIIPNVFTPNGDGVNDLFRITAKFVDEYEIAIFNRWGNLIARADWLTSGWDGRTEAGVEASNGVYFYVIKAKGFDGQELEFKGHFTLKR